MPEKDIILEHLRESLLKTEPGSKESNEAAKVLNEYINNQDEKRKNEVDQRLKQNIHDDEMVKNRDQAIIDEKHFKHQVRMDWIDRGLKVAGIVTTTVLTLIAIKDDKDGKPWWGIGKDFLSNLIRKSS